MRLAGRSHTILGGYCERSLNTIPGRGIAPARHEELQTLAIGLFAAEPSAAEHAGSLFLILGPARRPDRAIVLDGEIQVGSTSVSLERAVVVRTRGSDGRVAFAGPTLEGGTWKGPRLSVKASWTCG